jgi:glutathione S-transferase
VTARVIVTGSRSWRQPEAVHAALAFALGELGPLTVVHGGCPTGADAAASAWSRRFGCELEVWPADWERHGKAAGPRRNAAMVAAGADLVLAFPLGASSGTRGTMRLAVAAGIPVRDLGAQR